MLLYNERVWNVLRVPALLMFFTSVFANILMLVVPIYLIQIYNRILVVRSFETLLYLSLITIFSLLIYGVLETLRGIICQRASARFETAVAEPLMMKEFSNAGRKQGALMRDLGIIRSFVAGRTVQQFFDLPFAPLFLILLFVLHPLLGMIGLLGIAILLIIAIANHGLTRINEARAQSSLSEAHASIQTMSARADDVRAMGLITPLMKRWGAKHGRALNFADKVSGTNALFYGIVRFIRQALQVGMLGAGAYLVLVDDLSAGVIFAASIISSRAFLPIEQIIGSWPAMQNVKQASSNIAKSLFEVDENPERVELPEPQGQLLLDRVSLQLENGADEPISLVQDISLELRPGSALGIVGPSGAGKSTLGRLMVGLEAPTSGTVRLDGFPLSQWNEKQRRRAIGYIDQEMAMHPGTIAETISRFDDDAKDSDIVSAAKLAGAHGLIASLPEGYQSRIGTNSLRLSGGQRQQIALARALYGSPKLLVLDEPNAHLDPAGEQSLAKAIVNSAKAGAAVVIITQRTPILQVCHQVMTLRAGKIVAIGPAGKMLKPISASDNNLGTHPTTGLSQKGKKVQP